MSGKLVKVSGPLVIAEGLADVKISDLVKVGKQRLFGEVLSVNRQRTAIKVFEDTEGLALGDELKKTGAPLSLELGPGLLGGVFDGLGRALSEVRAMTGNAITGGVEAPMLSRARTWGFSPKVEAGDRVSSGDVIGVVEETAAIVHKIMVPVGAGGTVVSVQNGSFPVSDTVCLIRGDNGENHVLTLAQSWATRRERPFGKKLLPSLPMSTGQRVIDTLFPIGKGGTGVICGANCRDKSDLARQLVKNAEADVVVYVTMGGSGSALAELQKELRSTRNPRSGEMLSSRTVVIANTADMPLMSCDTALCTGSAIAEYYRDMGYDVLLVADSLTRWAEALREISGHLGEPPCDEGYPAYLGRQIARFFRRAGFVECLGSDSRRGSLTVIGAVSPSCGDVSEPVTQGVRRIVRAFWELEESTCFPALTITSYSHYADSLAAWFDEKFGGRFLQNRKRALELLGQEADLKEKIKLAGEGALSPEERELMETAELLREELYGGSKRELKDISAGGESLD